MKKLILAAFLASAIGGASFAQQTKATTNSNTDTKKEIREEKKEINQQKSTAAKKPGPAKKDVQSLNAQRKTLQEKQKQLNTRGHKKQHVVKPAAR